MDYVLTELRMSDSAPLRDSISTILSTDRSVGSSTMETPGSSPASSVVFMSRQGSDFGMMTPQTNGRARKSSFSSAKPNPKRFSSLPTPTVRKTPISRSSAAEIGRSPSPAARYASPTPTASKARPPPPTDNRPRWNGSTNLSGTSIGHNFKPLTLTTPSPYRKSQGPGYQSRSTSRASMAGHSPLSRSAAQAAMAGATSRPPSALATPSNNRISYASPSPDASPLVSTNLAKHRAVSAASGLPTLKNTRRSSYMAGSLSRSTTEMPLSPPPKPPVRPGSVATSRRVSMLPQPKKTPVSGRESRQGARSSLDERPVWRP